MSRGINPAEIDIAYLHEHSVDEITPDIEDAFIELVGKNVSDGMSDSNAREKAFQGLFWR